MAEKYYYSASRGGFYLESYRENYKSSANGWPDDAVSISEKEYKALIGGQVGGKVITADDNGKPVLSDRPAPTQAQQISTAESERDELMSIANAAITPLQDAVDIDDATDAEIALLKAWKKYRVALNRLDLSTAPDITWPESPADSKSE